MRLDPEADERHVHREQHPTPMQNLSSDEHQPGFQGRLDIGPLDHDADETESEWDHPVPVPATAIGSEIV